MPECDILFVEQDASAASSGDLVSSGILQSVVSDAEAFIQGRGLPIEVSSYTGLTSQGLPNVAAPLLSADKLSSVIMLRREGVPFNKTVGTAENELATFLQDRYLSGSGSVAGKALLSYVGVAGVAPFVVDGVASAARDMQRSNPICVPSCFAVLAFVVRSWRLMLVTMACMLCANLLCFAILALSAEAGVVVSTSVPVVAESTLIALTFDYSLFLLVRFQEERAIGCQMLSAVATSVRRSGHVIVGSGFTLCYCSLVVQILPMDDTRSMGLGILVSILCAMGVNLLVTPALLLGFPDFFAEAAGPMPDLQEHLQKHDGYKQKKVSVEDSRGIFGVLQACSSWPQNRAFSDAGHDSQSDDDDDVLDDDSDDEDEPLSAPSPYRKYTKQERRELARARREALTQATTSQLWKWWSRVVTTPICSVIMLALVLVAAVCALVGPTAIHMNSSQVTEDFILLGPEGSQTLQTLDRIGQEFSRGFMGPTTMLIAAKPVSGFTSKITDAAAWEAATTLLQKVDQYLLQKGSQGSIVSVMYLNDPSRGETAVPISLAVSADKMSESDPKMITLVKELKYAFNQTVNADRTAAFAMISPNLKTTSPAAVEWTEQLRKLADMENNAESSPIEVYVESQTAQMLDVELGVFSTFPWLVVLSLIGCIIMVGFIYRSVLVAVRSIVTIVFTLAVVYMFAHGIFGLGWLRNAGIPVGGTEGLFFMVPVTTFTIVLGLALDYDIFLLGRMVELRERGRPSTDAVAEGVAQTGHVITCAGLMMAIAFGGLLLSEVPSMRQASCIFVSAVLLDTFLVRTALTPALTAALGEANWWPREFKR